MVVANNATDVARRKGKLKIFFGYCAGVGKTYAMLQEAHEKLEEGLDVVIGYIEPHDRPETTMLIHNIPIIPTHKIQYMHMQVEELAIDAAIERQPDIILIDELAHTNIPGMRNAKRYQDVEELLNMGIDVYTTVNVQHIESLNNVVEHITNIKVKETIPDYIFNSATTIKLIDIAPAELLERLAEGKIYAEEKIERALTHFFTIENLRLLREIAVHKIAEHISHENDENLELADKRGNMRILACIGTGPSTAKCLRWAARMSRAFHAPWTAIYVKSDELYMQSAEGTYAAEHIKLAETLGAKVVVMEGYHVAETIAEYARATGVTSIVIGKNVQTLGILTRFQRGIEEQIVKLVPGVEVHVISDTDTKEQQYKRRKRQLKAGNHLQLSWGQTFLMIATLAIATIISMILRTFGVETMNFAIFYIAAVLIVSRMTEGYFYGILTSVLSVILYDFYFVFPFISLQAAGMQAPFTFAILLSVALITSGLVGKMKQQTQSLVVRQAKTDLLYQMNQQLLMAHGYAMIAELVTFYLMDTFERSVIFYMIDDDGTPLLYTRKATDEVAPIDDVENEMTILRWVLINKKKAGRGTNTLSGSAYYFLPLVTEDKTRAVVGLDCSDKDMEKEDIFFLEMIVTQVLLALENQRLASDQHRVILASETEKMRSNVLRSISHDLRSPLTGILGSVSTILENKGQLPEETEAQLLTNVKAESQWLIRMVENLLAVTRINGETMKVTKTEEAVEEVVANAVNNVRRRFPGRAIHVKIPNELLFVEMDGILIVQVIMNLLENAIRYSPETSVIELIVEDKKTRLKMKVSDSGKGISPDILQQLFKTDIVQNTIPTDQQRGLGIGLSICRSIIEAHGGTITAENKASGGALVQFTLPKEMRRL